MNMDSYCCCTSGQPEFSEVSAISALLKIVSEENRLKIICILRNGEHCVCQIEKHVRLSQSLVSHHLKDLREAGIILDRKEGLNVHYRLTPEGERVASLVFQLK
jgi:DNA-binding transcriptional ArsR family regulator